MNLKKAITWILPNFQLKETVEVKDEGIKSKSITVLSETIRYIKKVVLVPKVFRDKKKLKQKLVPVEGVQYPLIFGVNGKPFAEGNLYIHSLFQDSLDPNMPSLVGAARDLTDFWNFIQTENIDFLDFPKLKHYKPTYRYKAHLQSRVQMGELATSTANRRIRVMKKMYKWMLEEKLFHLANTPWKESDIHLSRNSQFGGNNSFAVKKSDLTIPNSKSDDAFDNHIMDGGRLKPLLQQEQVFLIKALLASENTEMILIHLLALYTGARIQTVLTFRKKHVSTVLEANDQQSIRVPVGRATDIDTKNDKQMVLHIPKWLYEKLNIYVHSERAVNRRLKSVNGDTDNQYLFLSKHGSPHYTAKSERGLNPKNLRHFKEGQGVRQFITEDVLPYIRANFDPNFKYSFHDLRATFGMNLVDAGLNLVGTNKVTLDWVFDMVRSRLGHTSIVTTNAYLNFRGRLRLAYEAQQHWEQELHKLAGIEVDNEFIK